VTEKPPEYPPLDPKKVLRVQLAASFIGTFYTPRPNWEATDELKDKVVKLAFELADKTMLIAEI
jgi:hypothetical protein